MGALEVLAPALSLSYVGVLLTVMIWVTARRSRLSVWEGTVAGLLVFLPLPCLFWVMEHVRPASATMWNLLALHRLVMLIVASLFPGSPRTVAVMVGVFLLSTFAHALYLVGVDPLVWGTEIGITAIYGMVAGVIAFLRAQISRVEAQYRQARAALLAIREMAGATRALRDGVNTPLQTIELVSFLARKAHPSSAPFMDKLDASATRVRAVIEALKYEDQIDWEASELSFQAERRLALLQEALKRDTSVP